MGGAFADVACVLAACVIVIEGAFPFAPVVRTTAGRVRGLRGAGVRQYFGVPYATARRFQPPRDPLNWKGIYNAINRFGWCAQNTGSLIIGTEDCLQLDVYSPDSIKPEDKLPVLVLIYGGGYFLGARTIYDPEYLVIKDTVVVVPNYRVGVLGFLCINGAANLGLKDQVAALHWIQKNILAFGGDPDNVTILGCSSGATAVGMHILSKLSKGLFHKAVLMSGDPLSLWAFNLEHLKPALQDARKIAPNVQNKADVYKTFANAPVRTLLGATQDTLLYSRYLKYTPCVEDNSTDAFFHDTPFKIIQSGDFNKVPVIIGNTEVEGLFLYNAHNNETLKEWDENFTTRLPSVFSWCTKKEKRIVANQIKSYYFGNKTISKATMAGVVDYYSDFITMASVDAFSALLMEHSGKPVYRYVFSYGGSLNFFNLVNSGNSASVGATHGDDIFYLFRPLGLPPFASKPDKLFINRFTSMITNFMKFGEPTPQQTALLPTRWEPVPCWLRLDRHLTSQCGTQPAPPRGLLGSLCHRVHPGYGPCPAHSSCQGGSSP